MKYLTLIAIALLTGCQSLDMAGSSQYKIRQIIDENGRAGFDIAVKNGKEIALVKAHLEKKGEDFTIDLEEQGVAAFRGQEISANAAKLAAEQAAKAAVAGAIAYGSAGAMPLVGSALSGGGLPAALVGAGGGAFIAHEIAKPAPAQ